MQVRDVVVGADGRDVERDSARRVRTVHQNRHAPGVASFRDGGHRKHQRALGGDVIDDDETGMRADCLSDTIHQRIGIEAGIEYRDRAYDGSAGSGNECGGVRDRTVGMVGQCQLVAVG